MDRRLRNLAAFLAMAILASLAMGATPSLISIGVVDNANPESAIYAVSSDGQFAVGYSMAPNSDQTKVIRHPMFWSAQTGIVKLPNPAPTGPGSDIDGEARGIVYRPLHPSQALGIAGSIATTPEPAGDPPVVAPAMHFYWATLANPAGGTWNIGDPSNKMTELGAFNTARMQASSATGQEGWYIVGHRKTLSGGNINRAYRLRVNSIGVADWYALYQDGDGECVALPPPWTPDMCCPAIGYGMANSVDGAGRAVGYDDGGSSCTGKRRALWFPQINHWGMVIPGGSGLLSEALGLSASGGIVSGYDASVIDGTTVIQSKAFIWRGVSPMDPAMRLLDNLPGDTQGSAIAVTAAETAGGYSSDGTNERAVIWDKTGMWDNTGQPRLLIDLLIGQGVNVSAWSKLTRVTSMSENGQTVAGWGVWAADGSTRGFIATSGNAVGSCCLRTGLGTGTCMASVTPEGCSLMGGTYLGDNSSCGTGNANCNFCGTPWADTNFDHDVDMDDFGLFQACFGLTPVTVQCGCLDKAAPKGTIDLSDFQQFLECETGPNVPYVTNPNCES